MEDNLLEFLVESNAIEEEFSKSAAVDAIRAWKYGVKNKENMHLEVVRGIHYQLMRKINLPISGKIRKVQVSVGKEICMQPEKIYDSLTRWCAIYNSDKTWDYIKKRHIEFLKIHPFEDGNGRTGRILMNLQRINAGMEILVIHVGDEQSKYYKWFN